jgi:hypothetical protein
MYSCVLDTTLDAWEILQTVVQLGGLRGRICACRRKTQSLSIDVQLILVCKDLSISNSEVNALAGLPGMSRNVETI